MKKIGSLVLTAMLALALAGFVGCSQSTSSAGMTRTGSAGGAATSPAGGTCVSFIDVGKGDCILLQAGDSAALIDAGFDDTSDAVLSYLRACGIDHLDYLVITHYDKDHVGGLRAIGTAVPIGKLYLPGYEGSDKNYRTLKDAIGSLGLASQQVVAELPLPLGDAVLSLFPSDVDYVPGRGGSEGNDNDVSLVASLTCGGDSYLFAGDLEKEGIATYLALGGHGRFDVLKVPHHGQKSSYTDEFLDDVRPQIAIITDSADDPADRKTLKMLDEIGADTYRTSTSGTIVVEGDGAGNYSVSTSRG